MGSPPRTSNRAYRPAALEAWFRNLGDAWEGVFDAEALRRGRELYREGVIAELELSEDDAIAHCRFSREWTCYAVIEWGKGGPSVRASIEDSRLGRAVGVAGLYEIEELVADEIPAVPGEACGGDEAANAPHDANASEEAGGEPDGEREEAPPRRLLPRLEGRRAGLRLKAFWVDGAGERVPAIGGDPGDPRPEERERLVRMTGRAKSAGFVFQRDHDAFLLAEPKRIRPFFTHALPKWREAFGEVEMDEEARRLAEGVRSIRVIGRVGAASDERMRVDWRMKLDGSWLEPGEAERIARAGRGTHVVPGVGLVQVGEAQADALQEWRVAAAAGSEEARLWPRYMVFSLFGDRGAELDLESELDAWRRGLEAAETSSSDEPTPDFLRAYQAYGARWMANLRDRGAHGLLADEMGLGKTLQVLTLFWLRPERERPSLIVCPASVVPVWQSEVRRWYPELETKALKSSQDFAAEPGRPALWIASYTQLRRHKAVLDRVSFGYAVLDEAQQIKNPDAKVTQACCSIRARTRIALTGTPLENRLLDVWTLFRFLMPGLLGPRRRFEEAAAAAGVAARREFEERLRAQIAPFVLRRTKDQVGSELPSKVTMDLVCPIGERQRQVYDRFLAQGRSEMGERFENVRERSAGFFTLLTRLRQVCCDPGLTPGVEAEIEQSGKIRALLTRLEEALAGDGSRKVVVFSQFVELLRRLAPLLRRSFPELALLELTGATRDRSEPVERFQEGDGPAVILVSLRAGGSGITLHAADYVFLLDPWWNPAVEAQAIDRVHRIGQRRRVFVYRMITEGTIEERLQRYKSRKRELFDQTVGALERGEEDETPAADLEILAELLRE